MRGDQLARQWHLTRAIEASPNTLTLPGLAKCEEIGIKSIYRNREALHEPGFPLYTERINRSNHWLFIDTFKTRIRSQFPIVKSFVEIP